MQFGVGILGQRWNPEEHLSRLLADRRAPRVNFHLHAECYAAKIAAETILSETPSAPDLSDEGIVRQCADCALAVRRPEAPMVRDAFFRIYGQQTFEMGAA